MRTKQKTKGAATEVDAYVGKRLCLRRMMLGLSQTKLADAAGVTFQQIQKYEKGHNRITSGRLYQLSRLLSVPVGYFFEGYEGPEEHSPVSDDLARQFPFNLNDPEILRLLRVYYQVPDPLVRKRFVALLAVVGECVPSGTH